MPRYGAFAGWKQATNKQIILSRVAVCPKPVREGSVQFVKEMSTKSNKKSENEIDISRENPYSEMTFNEKGNYIFGYTATYR